MAGTPPSPTVAPDADPDADADPPADPDAADGPADDRVADRIEAILARLKERYPPEAVAEPGGDRQDPFRSLIATILSQRTNDDVTYPVAKDLFDRWSDAPSLAAADVDEVREVIRRVGFYNQKAPAVVEVARRIVEDHAGEVPADREVLEELPMVGPKTSACVMCYGFGADVVAVDTHVHRISNRLGLVETTTPEKTEAALTPLVPEGQRRVINELLVRFGRDLCKPRGPRCGVCPLNDLCPSAEVERDEAAEAGEERDGGPTMLARVSREDGPDGP